MIILDTCILIFDALNPDKLSPAAKKAITEAQKHYALHCCDISLWEIAMLVQKNRLDPGTDVKNFLQLTLEARSIQVLPITLEIAALSTTTSLNKHTDPADRLITATAIHHRAKLITSDQKLHQISALTTIW